MRRAAPQRGRGRASRLCTGHNEGAAAVVPIRRSSWLGTAIISAMNGQLLKSAAMKGRATTRMVARSDVAIAYAVVVTGLAFALAVLPDHVHDQVVQQSSTNLVNLHRRPLWVLFASAFVVARLGDLWQIPLLLLLYAAAQKWVGRAATIAVAFFGHIGATLFVATLLGAEIFHGSLARSVARASDVGVSYGLACLAGFLLARVAPRWRIPYFIALCAAGLLPLVLSPDFTAVGHASALAIGLSLALIATRVEHAPHSAARHD